MKKIYISPANHLVKIEPSAICVKSGDDQGVEDEQSLGEEYEEDDVSYSRKPGIWEEW